MINMGKLYYKYNIIHVVIINIITETPTTHESSKQLQGDDYWIRCVTVIHGYWNIGKLSWEGSEIYCRHCRGLSTRHHNCHTRSQSDHTVHIHFVIVKPHCILQLYYRGGHTVHNDCIIRD